MNSDLRIGIITNVNQYTITDHWYQTECILTVEFKLQVEFLDELAAWLFEVHSVIEFLILVFDSFIIADLFCFWNLEKMCE